MLHADAIELEDCSTKKIVNPVGCLMNIILLLSTAIFRLSTQLYRSRQELHPLLAHSKACGKNLDKSVKKEKKTLAR